MSIHKKNFEKLWVGSVSFTATEIFDDLNKAVAVSVPTTAAKIVIDNKTLSYEEPRKYFDDDISCTCDITVLYQ